MAACLDNISKVKPQYRGRIAPTPSGKLHIGHVQTFLIAQKRAQQFDGKFLLRIEDLDKGRCKPQYLDCMIQDMLWIGLKWDEGPCIPGTSTADPTSMYIQTNRMDKYFKAMKKLFDAGYIYPSRHSRRDVERCLSAPQEGDGSTSAAGKKRSVLESSTVSMEEVDTEIFPSILRPQMQACRDGYKDGEVFPPHNGENWRFRVPYDWDGVEDRTISFEDGYYGLKEYICGVHFGDFIVWGGQEYKPSYELAVVVDDADMDITEVVRGADLLLSTARQLLLYEALELTPPAYYHVPLVRDEEGKRLAKRSFQQKYTIETLRNDLNYTPSRIIQELTRVETL